MASTYYPSEGYFGYGILKVVVTKTKILIYKKKDVLANKIPLKKQDTDYTQVYEIKSYKNIFIGKTSTKYGVMDSNTYQRHLKPVTGSYLLVQVKDLEYIYITNYAFRFKTLEPIQEFYSYLAKPKRFPKSQHAFPFALTEHYAYLFDNNKYLKRDFGDINPWSVYFDSLKNSKKKWNIQLYDYNVKYLTNTD